MKDEETLKIENLPKPIADKLAVTAARIRRILFLRGLFAVLSISLVTILAVMLIDAASMLFSMGFRWLLTLSAFAIIGAAIYYHLIRPLRRRLSLSEIARIIETRSENLQDERISSTVEILGRQYKKGEEFSPVLLNQLVKDAEKDADVILPQQLFTLQSAKRFMVALGVIGFVYLLIFVVWPGPSSRLLVRAVAPFARVGGALADQLSVEPGDIRMAAGDPLTVKVSLNKATTKEVELRTRWEGRSELVEQMQSADPENAQLNFSTGFSRVTENFEYRIRSGHALTAFYQVQVFPRPEINEMEVTITPPAYTGLPPVSQSSGVGKLSALVGSTLKLKLAVNSPVNDAELFLADVSMGQAQIENSAEGNFLYWEHIVKAPARNIDWSVNMTSVEGFDNKPVRNHVYEVFVDEAPVVEIVNPVERQVTVPPNGFITLAYRVQDQYGLQKIELVVTPQGGKAQTFTQDPRMESSGQWSGSFPLQLQSLNVGSADRIKLEVIATDTLPESLGGPNRGTSNSLTLILEKNSDNLARQQVQAQHQLASKGLKETIEALETVNAQTSELKKDLQSGDASKAMDKAAELRASLVNTDTIMRELSEALQGSSFDPIGEAVAEIANDEIAAARVLGEKIPLTDDKNLQQEMVGDLHVQAASALEKVRELNRAIEEMARNAEKLAELQELKNQQDALLAEAADEAWEENHEAWQARQDALALELGAVSDAEQALEDMVASTAVAAAEMDQAADQAEEAVALANEIDLPAWMIAQDKALMAQKEALKSQAKAIALQNQAAKKKGKEMAGSQKEAADAQAQAVKSQLVAEIAQVEALKLLEADGRTSAIEAQKTANALQGTAKGLHTTAEKEQSAASHLRAEAEKVDPPNFTATEAKQKGAIESQRRAFDAQKKAIAQQDKALEQSVPDLDQAISDAVAKQQAAEAAQQEALQSQAEAQKALNSDASAEDVSQAQQSAEQAQQNAAQAQQEALNAQEAAAQFSESDDQNAALEAQKQAVDAQSNAKDAQDRAKAAADEAAKAEADAAHSGEEAATALAEAARAEASKAQESATAAQEAAVAAQEAASAAQPQTATSEAQSVAQAATDAAQAAAEAAEQAAASAVEAGFPEEATALNSLADDAATAAQAMAEAASQPGLPSSQAQMAGAAKQMAQTAAAMASMAATPATNSPLKAEAMAAAAQSAAAAATAQSQNQAMAEATAASQALNAMTASLETSLAMSAPSSDSKGQNQSSSSEPTTGMSDHGDGPQSEALPEWVSDIGMTRADWVRMKALSDPDGEAVEDLSIPREYRQLVRDYFLQLSQENAGKN